MDATHLTTEVRWALGIILGVLCIASVIVWAKCKFEKDKDHRELAARIRTWWMIIGLFGAAVVLSERALLFFLGFVSFLALKEFLSLIPTRRADRRVLFWAYLAIPFQYYWVSLEWYGMFIIFIPVFLFLLIPTRMVMTGQTEGFLRSAGTVHWGAMTTVFSLSHAAFLMVLTPVLEPRAAYAWPTPESAIAPGPGLLIFLVALTQFNDVAQYVWGTSIGKRKIAPHVSPGKTLGGLVGGVGTTALVGWLIGPRLTLMDGTHALIAGLIIGVAGFFGDLSISAMKRDLGVKDSGSILPGHGGILDRVDSLTYTAPLFFHYVYYYYF